MTCSTLQGMRTEENFSLFFEMVELFRKQVGVEEPSLPRKRKRPQRYETGDAEPHYSITVQDHYRKIYFEVIDLAVNGITNRFEQPGYAKYTKLESLLLKAAIREDYSEELEAVTSFYHSDIDAAQLSMQLEILEASFSEITETLQSVKATIHDVLQFLRGLSDSQRLLMQQVCNVARLLLTLPATNATSERTFSTMRRLMTYLRSTMSQTRLNNVMILSIYKELLDELDLHDLANQFVSGSESRLRVFGTF